jgi:glutamine amidotransferase
MTDQAHSLVSQSMAAREAKTDVNADGCGLGWYGERAAPGIYRSILPAWSDPNLPGLMGQIRSRLFMAHVRSATSGGVSYTNCHPFTHSNRLFMHNGMISNYRKLRARIESLIDETLYENCHGTTDSEALFHIGLSRGLLTDPHSAITRTLSEVVAITGAQDQPERVRFAAALSDGEELWGFRWASDNRPPTLYHRSVDSGTVLASEPFDEESGEWNAVPPNTAVRIAPNGKVDYLPIDLTVGSRQ